MSMRRKLTKVFNPILGKQGTSKRRLGKPTMTIAKKRGNYSLVDTRKSKKR